MPTHPRIILSAAVLLSLPGCADVGSPKPPPRRPTEVETRDAYFNTPVILEQQGREVALGTSKAVVFANLGASTISYRSGTPPRRQCVVYPISGTQVWDELGSPEAAEWEFCFDGGGRVVSRHRLAAGGRGHE